VQDGGELVQAVAIPAKSRDTIAQRVHSNKQTEELAKPEDELGGLALITQLVNMVETGQLVGGAGTRDRRQEARGQAVATLPLVVRDELERFALGVRHAL